jgi:hypothetical protein
MEVEAMRHGPMQDLQRGLFRARGGTMFRPEYLVAAALAGFGGLFTACAGVVTWILAHR